jgi:AmiR/NasT family two-component response regulator
LSDEQFADALAVAHVASRTVLAWQSVAGPGSLAWQLEHVPMHRAIVHQATGMVSVQAAVSIPDAVVMLRAYAFAEDRPISDVAAAVVGGDLRLDGHAA